MRRYTGFARTTFIHVAYRRTRSIIFIENVARILRLMMGSCSNSRKSNTPSEWLLAVKPVEVEGCCSPATLHQQVLTFHVCFVASF